MNKKPLLFALTLFLGLVGCSGNNNTDSEDISPDISFNEEGDKYIDEMPSDTKDGAILHCFNWTFNNIKDNLQTIANNGFKSVQVNPIQEPKNGGAQWWAYYQPISFTVAESSPLGTKEELKELCMEAEKYGISVIADIVANHLANKSETSKEEDGTPTLSPDVERFEPEIYARRNDLNDPTFHHNSNPKGSGVVTQLYPYGNLPDLNTANELVQERVYSLLKECIDLGIDGFRFDAAKHIETPDDPDYASNFWPNTLGRAKTYYKEKTGNDLFAYGEVLNDPEGGRIIKNYTDLMCVTDSGYIASHTIKFVSAKAQELADALYSKNTDAANLVTWIESHDTYAEATSHEKIGRLRKMWSVLASRKGSRGLFFARPDASLTVGKIADYTFEDETIATINRFHNRFVGADEAQYGEDTFYVNQRFDSKQTGAVIVGLGKDKNFKTDKLDKLKNGLYFDQISGQQVKVVQGKSEFVLDSTGIAVLTQTNNLPRPEIKLSAREGGFVDSKTIKVDIKNASSSSYSINGGEAIPFKNSVDIKIESKDADANKLVNIEILAKNNDFEVRRNAIFKLIDLIDGGFNVVNFNVDYFISNEVYLWKWNDTSKESKWSKDYKMEGNTMLVNVDGLDGFLIGLFPKGYTISVPTAWDSKIVKQSVDIKGETLKSGFFDAGNF